MTAPLSDIEIHRDLSTLGGWVRRGNSITKTFAFTSFPAGIDWVRRVGDLAERMQHHPDLDIRYSKITATLSTHSAGGITAKDFDLARGMDAL